jgi:hypothetical protein
VARPRMVKGTQGGRVSASRFDSRLDQAFPYPFSRGGLLNPFLYFIFGGGGLYTFFVNYC